MNLPKAVQAQAEQAEAAQQELIDGNTPAPEATDPSEPPQEPAPTPTPDPETPAPQASDPIDWQQRAEAAEHRYKVLQGKYNSEVKGGANAADPGVVTQLQSQVAQLQQQLAQAQQPPAPDPEPAPMPTPDLSRLADDYGEEFVGDIGKLIDNRVDQMVQQRMQNVDQTVNQLSHQQRVNLLTQRLAQDGIDFGTTNADPLFVQWLSEIEPVVGVPRQQLLNQAFSDGDIERAALIFRQYAQSAPAPNPVPQPQVNPQTLETVRTSAPPPADPTVAQPMWTPEAIAEFYSRRRRNLITDEEFERTEREIFAALSG